MGGNGKESIFWFMLGENPSGPFGQTDGGYLTTSLRMLVSGLIKRLRRVEHLHRVTDYHRFERNDEV